MASFPVDQLPWSLAFKVRNAASTAESSAHPLQIKSSTSRSFPCFPLRRLRRGARNPNSDVGDSNPAISTALDGPNSARWRGQFAGIVPDSPSFAVVRDCYLCQMKIPTHSVQTNIRYVISL